MTLKAKPIKLIPVKTLSAIVIITVLHVVGIVGIGIFESSYIVNLSWINLLVSFAIAILFFSESIKSLIRPFIFVFIIGFASESIGVNTGYLFGNYTYGSPLGFKFLGVPLTIGLMWLSLGIGAKNLASRFVKNEVLILVLAAVLMVCFDAIMEPIAIQLGFWTWEGNEIPLLNYLTWFCIAIVIQAIFWNKKTDNVMFEVIYLIQLFFFLSLNFLI